MANNQPEAVQASIKNWSVILGGCLLLNMWIVTPYIERKDDLLESYSSNIRLQEKAKEILAGKKDVLLFSENAAKIDAKNSKSMFAETKPPGGELLVMQKLLSTVMGNHNLNVKSITMGEPVVEKNSGYKRLPIAFTASGTEKDFNDFLVALQNTEQFMVMETLTVSVQRAALQVRGLVVGFTSVVEKQ